MATPCHTNESVEVCPGVGKLALSVNQRKSTEQGANGLRVHPGLVRPMKGCYKDQQQLAGTSVLSGPKK